MLANRSQVLKFLLVEDLADVALTLLPRGYPNLSSTSAAYRTGCASPVQLATGSF